MIKINCNECLAGRHELCMNDNCLCLSDNHGVKVPYKKTKSDETISDSKDYDTWKMIYRNQEECSEDPRLFNNSQFDLVADLIQCETYFLTFRENKDMWYYDKSEGIYKPFGDTIIAELCQKLVKKCTRKTVLEVTDTIRRSNTMIHMSELLESRLINTQNGILDPKTFELIPHSPEYYSITKLPFSINLHDMNLKLWNHILSIIDAKDINLIMELIWICISGVNPFKKLFVFKGDPNTQKTTMADILTWIIGSNNVSREKTVEFLGKNRFSTSKFIGKRINISSEIGNMTQPMLESLKSLVGAELQNTERKNDNTERYFDPTRFVFLFTTNKLGEIYSSINDNSIITRFQFLIFRNRITEESVNGLWCEEFFTNEKDKQSSIDTVVNIVINYKKSQLLGKARKTKWSSALETKNILKEEMPKEDKYFEDERIISKGGSSLRLKDIKNDFESFVGYNVSHQQMGLILKKNGFKSTQTNGMTIFKGLAFTNTKVQDQKTITSVT